MGVILFLLGTVLGARLLLRPLGLGLRLAAHSGRGFLCLWLLNQAAPVTGVAIPVNAATVALSGALGLPGLGLLALLETL